VIRSIFKGGHEKPHSTTLTPVHVEAGAAAPTDPKEDR
jgi:hypothetical protein